jgi:hypothetical protein
VNDAVLAAGDRLHLRFSRRGDRWEHAVHLQSDSEIIWQLNSDEGTADDLWPRSPPFQTLELHTQADGRKFALLVGMAGASHWSASIETDPISQQFVFDVACRVKIEPAWLGSSYVVGASGGKNNIRGPGVAERPRIETIALESTVGCEQPMMEVEGQRVVVRPADKSSLLPRTVRWKYAISASLM